MVAGSSRRSSRHVMQLHRPGLFPAFFPPHKPQRSHQSSSHLPSLSFKDGPICGRARIAPGRERHGDVLCTATFFPHILWMHGHTSAPAIETMNYPCWLQSFRLKHDNSSSGINASRAPCSHATAWIPWGFMSIFDNFILEGKKFVYVLSHLQGNLNLISMLHI